MIDDFSISDRNYFNSPIWVILLSLKNFDSRLYFFSSKYFYVFLGFFFLLDSFCYIFYF